MGKKQCAAFQLAVRVWNFKLVLERAIGGVSEDLTRLAEMCVDAVFGFSAQVHTEWPNNWPHRVCCILLKSVSVDIVVRKEAHQLALPDKLAPDQLKQAAFPIQISTPQAISQMGRMSQSKIYYIKITSLDYKTTSKQDEVDRFSQVE